MTLTPLPVCWEPERIPQAVWLAARLGEESAHYFLATHSPVENIIPEKGFLDLPQDRQPNEEDLYASLMSSWQQQNPDRDIRIADAHHADAHGSEERLDDHVTHRAHSGCGIGGRCPPWSLVIGWVIGFSFG